MLTVYQGSKEIHPVCCDTLRFMLLRQLVVLLRAPSWQQAAEPSCVCSPSLTEDSLQKPKLGLPVSGLGVPQSSTSLEPQSKGTEGKGN